MDEDDTENILIVELYLFEFKLVHGRIVRNRVVSEKNEKKQLS